MSEPRKKEREREKNSKTKQSKVILQIPLGDLVDTSRHPPPPATTEHSGTATPNEEKEVSPHGDCKSRAPK